MGRRLDQSEPVFGIADMAFEQRGETVPCRSWYCDMRLEPAQRTVVVFDQLMQTQGQPGEGQLVPPQHQMVVTRDGGQAFTGLEPVGHGIGVGFSGVDPDIRTDRRQDLIARKNEVVIA